MYDVNDLRSVFLFNHLPEQMLEKILDITTTRKYDEGEYIFKEGDYADYIYSIISGQVDLKVAKNSSTLITVSRSTKGMTFGSSALVDTDNKKYLGYAIAVKDCKLFAWKGSDLEKLFYENHEIGFLVMRKFAQTLNTTLEIFTSRFAETFG